MTDLNSIIEIKDLKMTFPGKGKRPPVEAVRGVNFEVKEGEIFGLLGPNGAGKTTTMRMLCTLLEPTGGHANIAGQDLRRNPARIRNNIGYVSQVGGMQRESSGRENIALQAKLYGMSKAQADKRVAELIDLLNMKNFADRKTKTYSGGQRRLFDLAGGIVHNPKILFLDEPSTGLDPQNRAHIWEQVKKLHNFGTTVFLTTHYLDEADALCNRVAIVDHGKIVAIDTPDELKRQVSGDVVTLSFVDHKIASEATNALTGEPFIREVRAKDEVVNLHVDKGDENLPFIIKNLHQKNIVIKSIQLSRPSLDDVFLKLTGRTIRESESAAS